MTQILMLNHAINLGDMSMQNKLFKHSFLLSKSVIIPDDPRISSYDFDNHLNISIIGTKKIPSVLYSNNIGTQSKTFAASGDDDPDMDAEICY